VLFLQGQSKPVDDASQNLQKFSNAIVSLGLVDELKEYVVDGSTNKGTQVQELAVYSVQRCL